jgi:DEAD/DEAH box helicase domain-containing protein
VSLEALLEHWRLEPSIFENIADWRTIPASSAILHRFPPDLHPVLKGVLQEQAIQSLYSHQAAAWEKIKDRQNIVVVTGTASGKTLCYNLPILDHLLRRVDARALYIFPTKALAQDQLKQVDTLITGADIFRQRTPIIELTDYPPVLPIAPAIYDGDTPQNRRPAIRKKARLVISNPDMLHTGVLPHHTAWADFFRSLRFIVIDELHAYRGVFGSHVANVLRRLLRITHFYGASPQIILTSATIANPQELAQRLTNVPVSVIDEDGSEKGAKHFIIYNPPVIDPDLGIRQSLIHESVRLASDLITYQVQSIIFGRARRTVELILSYLRQNTQVIKTNNHQPLAQLSTEQVSNSASIRGYRSGYLPNQRREIEQGLRLGSVQVVVATNALELGIDIGRMGAALLAGYPGTIASTWQQAGRAGRSREASLALLITSASPLDQYLARHPDYFYGRSPEHALINPDHPVILLDHLQCAAFELPFRKGDTFGSLSIDQLQDYLDFLTNLGVLHTSGPKYFWMSDQYPAQNVSLRSSSPDEIILQSLEVDGRTQVVGQVDLESAYRLVHPGAVYLHEGQVFLVEQLNLEEKIAWLQQAPVDYFTMPRGETTVEIVTKLDHLPIKGGMKSYGELIVTTHITGYKKRRWNTHETLADIPLDLPPSKLQTIGYWITIAQETVQSLEAQGLWNNTPNKYGPMWNDIRKQVRARDGYRCQVCGKAENGRNHEVHHKIPFRTFASTVEANQLTNLITLCAECHRRVETSVRIRSGLAGLGYVLGNLAPFFLMCDPGDLGIHTDPQSPLGDGQPVIVIYDQIPAGIGFSVKLYEIHEELIRQSAELITGCSCTDGCPSCVGPGGENGAGGKKETLALLSILNS